MTIEINKIIPNKGDSKYPFKKHTSNIFFYIFYFHIVIGMELIILIKGIVG